MRQIKGRLEKMMMVICMAIMMATIAGCGNKSEDTAAKSIPVENENEMIGEADLIIPETQEELEAYIEEIKAGK